ncbi:unnamed protein product [Callosobruchus maculatus]|uniref:RRM domain-containing protein n=1 Tax=Callosobruchus maculatus TaxID=64391 RepID=A0A653BQT8_CALMS|nr:unnamed protein product [Callosobruchus maculatus]
MMIPLMSLLIVMLESSADPEAVRQELNKVQFGGGYLSAEFKKDREDDYNINPEDIDPTTLYVGNLAQEVTKDDMLRMYPTSKRIDIGYAKKMKFTRYAFVAFKNAVDAIEAYKKTHDTQMYNKSLIVRFRRMNGTIGMLGEPKVQSKTDKDRSQSKSSETNGQMPSEENENETVDNNPWNIDVSTWEESYDDMYDDDCMLDVKPSLEDLEKDVKVPRDIDQFLLRDNLEDFFSPNILDEAKREITSEDATRRDTFSDSHNKTSIRLQEDHNDIHPSPNTSEVDNSELDNPVKVKDEIKSEVDQTRDDKSLRSTYRQLMLTRRKKNLAIKVEEDNNAIKTEAGRSETSNLEKERVDDLFGVNASKSDRETNQEHLKDSISIADDDRGPQENIEEIEKKVKEETPHSLTNRCISTYGELKEFGMKMQITRKVMVKEEIESVGCDLQDDQLHAVDVQEADTDLSLDTGITGQAQGGQNVQSSELSRNEDNLTNTMTSSQTNNAHGSTLEFDSCTEVNARQNQAAEQENGEFNFDVDLNSLLTDVKKEPRVEDYENYDELDEEEDDDIENFLKRRKAQI